MTIILWGVFIAGLAGLCQVFFDAENKTARKKIETALDDPRFNRRSRRALRRITGLGTPDLLRVAETMPLVEIVRDDAGELWFRFSPK